MPLYNVSVSARLAPTSPSVSAEKGAYHMRIPPSSPSKLRRFARRESSLSAQEKQLAILVVFLISATMSCFGAAYYLFTTRWETRNITRLQHDSDDYMRPQVVDFDFSPPDEVHLSASAPAPSEPMDYDEKFFAYLPHSGFHNQRIAFENAVVLSRLLNRTLLVPPVRLGNKPLYYLPFDELRAVLANSSKQGLNHCRNAPLNMDESPECLDYSDYTYVPWGWLVNLTHIKSEQRLVPCANLTEAWLEEHLRISANDTFALKDTNRNQYSFKDFSAQPLSLARKYLESVEISALASRPERLLMLGTLFGSSRLHLRTAANYRLRQHVREAMAFTNPLLAQIAEDVRRALAGAYLAAHIRLGDGLFQENAHANARLVWWRLLHSTLGMGIRDTLALERTLLRADADGQYEPATPPLIPLDVPALRVPHPPMAPLPANPRDVHKSRLSCPGELHEDPNHQLLNTPLFISTDVAYPHEDPLLSRFLRTFPCTFFLADFADHTAALDRLESGYDGVKLKPFLMPFLDAMIAARAWQVVGTEQSTFSAFVQDVLWRTYHGFEIVQRG
ncbi:hypothetical protein WOLCODRAFT_143158 [Wolfiporia cocos MD-104 SS10]|uniref:CigA protein n=1 Tax=Wolfiporia cocos (strain MD-104) TaxID=742152 RepID=A0A2H3JEB6_WOLCO|nr:hypothetical protein WOLCODRAFT_143158 [Wolfiporia cocos MD-104 SS10]